MLIDWFTVIAQALNFLILVGMLKHFLYKPILDAIDQREKRIATALADADLQKSEALKERDIFQQKNAVFEQERNTRMAQVSEEANRRRHELLDEARTAAENLAAKRQAMLNTEQASLRQELLRHTQQEVFAIARKTLQDLAGVNLEEQMIVVFGFRLQALTEIEKEELVSALKSSPSPLTVRTTFPLSEKQMTLIRTLIAEALATGFEVNFETTPELVSGIELSTNGYKLAWSIADYLASLEKSIRTLCSEKGLSMHKLKRS